MKPRKPTRKDLESAHTKAIPDLIRPGLEVLFVGINPGLYSAAVGHNFARPGNRFWPTLFKAGLTPRLFSPFEEEKLIELGYGITNFVARPSATAAEITREELRAGATRLREKIRHFCPKRVAVLGVSAYTQAFDLKKTKVGRQAERLEGAELWVLPNPSGLNAHYQLPALAKLFREIRA